MKKPNGTAPPKPNETAFERFQRLARKVITTPKTKIAENKQARREAHLLGKLG